MNRTHDEINLIVKRQATVRLGGKGTIRRKKKVFHRRGPVIDEKRMQAAIKNKVNNPQQLPSVETVTMFKEDGTILRFTNPKVQVSFPSNMMAITGSAQTKTLVEEFGRLMPEMGPEQLRAFGEINGLNGTGSGAKPDDGLNGNSPEEDDEEIPTLTKDFEAVSLDDESSNDDE